MELYQLRTFVTVAREGHQTRAAEKLHLSQPAISAQLKALEEEFESTLFEKTATGVALTPAGQALLTQAERVLAECQRLTDIARSLHQQIKGRVRLGTIIDPDFLKLGRILGVIVERHPLIHIETVQGISGLVIEQVRKGDVDAGFFLGENPNPEIAAHRLRDVPYRIVGPRRWRTTIETADWAEIAGLPWIGTPPYSSHTRITQKLFASRGLTISKVAVADQEASMISMVIAGLGLSLMRDDLAQDAERRGQLVIWPKAKAEIPLSFVCRVDNEQRPEIQALIRIVLDVWAQA